MMESFDFLFLILKHFTIVLSFIMLLNPVSFNIFVI